MIEQAVFFDAFDDGPPPGRGRGQLLLQCDPAVQLVVRMVFAENLVWEISRNLLLQGVQYPAGCGDIRIEPYRTRIAVTLSNPAGRSLLLLDRPPVDLFCQQVRDIKDDAVDVDGLIKKIFAEDWL